MCFWKCQSLPDPRHSKKSLPFFTVHHKDRLSIWQAASGSTANQISSWSECGTASICLPGWSALVMGEESVGLVWGEDYGGEERILILYQSWVFITMTQHDKTKASFISILCFIHVSREREVTWVGWECWFSFWVFVLEKHERRQSLI